MVSEVKKQALRTVLQSVARTIRCIDRALLKGGSVPGDVYDVLVTLEYVDGNRLRLSQLADEVVLSRSGLSRLVDRMEKQGLIRREQCPGDKRGTYAVLTDAGRAERLRSWPAVEAEIARVWDKSMTDADAVKLTKVFAKLSEVTSTQEV